MAEKKLAQSSSVFEDSGEGSEVNESEGSEQSQSFESSY